MANESTFRKVMAIFALIVVTIRLFYQWKAKQHGGEAEIQPQGASFVLASEAALINIIFGLVHLFRPGAGYWRSAAVCRGRPIMPWPRTSAA